MDKQFCPAHLPVLLRVRSPYSNLLQTPDAISNVCCLLLHPAVYMIYCLILLVEVAPKHRLALCTAALSAGGCSSKRSSAAFLQARLADVHSSTQRRWAQQQTMSCVLSQRVGSAAVLQAGMAADKEGQIAPAAAPSMCADSAAVTQQL
jgi:hypothetical protein